MIFKVIIFFYGFFFSIHAYAEIDMSSCEKQLKNENIMTINCVGKFKLSNDERNEILKRTSTIVNDISCDLKINISKEKIFKALAEDEFNLPPMQVNCYIEFKDKTIKEGTINFSPYFRLKGDTIVQASLNIKEVNGLGFFNKIIKQYLASDKTNENFTISANDAYKKLAW